MPGLKSSLSSLRPPCLPAPSRAPAYAFEVLPNPNLTGGSVRIDGHDLNATCGHSKEHRSWMNHARRDEILTRYGLPRERIRTTRSTISFRCALAEATIPLIYGRNLAVASSQNGTLRLRIG